MLGVLLVFLEEIPFRYSNVWTRPVWHLPICSDRCRMVDAVIVGIELRSRHRVNRFQARVSSIGAERQGHDRVVVEAEKDFLGSLFEDLKNCRM